ncbi:MAG: tRNA (guanosine(46)-N7)-methyltransferase TrmB [Alphaproteobacteria bacterium]
MTENKKRYQEADKPKFYGRRKGKKLNAQKKETLLENQDKYGIVLEENGEKIFPQDLFVSNPPEVWLEIGFGAGEHLINMARKFPQHGFIGCEPFINGVASMTKQLHEHQIENIRFFPDDMRLLLAQVPNASFEKIFVLFADPWPKKRHHKRRIINPENLALFERLLKKGGELQIATDHDHYLGWIEKELSLYKAFKIEERVTWTNAAEHPDWWIPTRYEEKALEKGISCTALRCIK